MMKNIFLLLTTLTSLCAFGQQEEVENPRDPKSREKLRAVHAAYITERIELTSSESEKFWPLYREYNEKKRGIRQQMRQAPHPGRDRKEILDLDIQLKQQEVDLEREYMAKLQQVISAEKLLRLKQAEIDFRRIILRQVQERRRHRR